MFRTVGGVAWTGRLEVSLVQEGWSCCMRWRYCLFKKGGCVNWTGKGGGFANLGRLEGFQGEVWWSSWVSMNLRRGGWAGGARRAAAQLRIPGGNHGGLWDGGPAAAHLRPRHRGPCPADRLCRQRCSHGHLALSTCPTPAVPRIVASAPFLVCARETSEAMPPPRIS
jgi:hypothetical protein